MAFVFILAIYDLLMTIIFGPSDFEMTLKGQKSMTTFAILVAIIVFKQKYEMQVLSKYKLENLNFGKVFHLPMFLWCSALATMTFYKFNAGFLFVHIVFLFAYFSFFWEKAKRTLGINRLFENQLEAAQMPSLFTEGGDINFGAIKIYL